MPEHKEIDRAEIIAKRLELQGTGGLSGLIRNGQTFAIAVFASLGGLVYGYNQGMFGQILTMNSFKAKLEDFSPNNPTKRSLLTAILELGAWVGTLLNGYIADAVGRRLCVVIAVVVFCVGVIVQATLGNYSNILGGRFVTGLGVGSLSMIVPLYNAELAPPEIRGSLVALQQLAITFGIMISYWIGYGTNFIGGTGDSQSNAAWLIPICIQIAPALVLGVGINFMPQSPRWLMNMGRDEECLHTLAKLRRLPTTDPLVQIEYLEIKAQRRFDVETSQEQYPQYQDGSFSSNFKLGVASYMSLLKVPNLRRRVTVACMIMVFQQWSGVNAILYYAPFIFQDFGLGASSVSLLASGVVGVVMFLATIPAVMYVDRVGRKGILVSGAIWMAVCHFVVAGILGQFGGHFQNNAGAGWAAAVFIWLFAIGFGYSWGPVAWIVVAEVFPLSVRARGVSIGASSNWLNNFAVGMMTNDLIATAGFGAYIFLGMMATLGALYVFFLTPETKGLTLEEMDEIFGDKSGRAAADNARIHRIEKELGLLRLLQQTFGGSFAADETLSEQSQEKELKTDQNEFA